MNILTEILVGIWRELPALIVMLVLFVLLVYAILRVHLLRRQLSQLQQKYLELSEQLNETSLQVISKELLPFQPQQGITNQSEDNHWQRQE